MEKENDNNIKKIIINKDIFSSCENNDESGEKKIKIVGTSNRYQIKKLTTDRNAPKKKRAVILDSKLDNYYFTFDFQLLILNEIKDSFENNGKLTKETGLAKSEIERKLNSYKHQDIEKNILEESKLIGFEKTIEKLLECEMKCHYCKKEMYILYELVRENSQWSLDRIDNDIGHNNDNVVISCLECNLKRRRQSKDLFFFTKNLKIVRSDI